MPQCFRREEEVMEGTGVGVSMAALPYPPTPLWGPPGRAGSRDARLDPSLPSYHPRCFQAPSFPAKVLLA